MANLGLEGKPAGKVQVLQECSVVALDIHKALGKNVPSNLHITMMSRSSEYAFTIGGKRCYHQFRLNAADIINANVISLTQIDIIKFAEAPKSDVNVSFYSNETEQMASMTSMALLKQLTD